MYDNELASMFPVPVEDEPMALDADGVLMMGVPKPTGSSWRLGTDDPNVTTPYFHIYESTATRLTEAGVTFWRSPGQSDGSATGRTHRLYTMPSGGTQNYTWLSNPGYLGNSLDLLNFELTAYIRPTNKIPGTSSAVNTSLQFIARGGSHDGGAADNASCMGMQVPYTGQTAKVYREYNHPNYDYIFPGRLFAYNYPGGTWLGMKMVSWLVTGGVHNELWLDTNPWTPSSVPTNVPSNNWQLYMVWNDSAVDTGLYTVPATWAGWQYTLRLDGFSYLDFAIYSAREIYIPGTEPTDPPPDPPPTGSAQDTGVVRYGYATPRSLWRLRRGYY